MITAINNLPDQAMFRCEALYEILADKGLITREEVVEHVKKLKRKIKVNLRPVN